MTRISILIYSAFSHNFLYLSISALILTIPWILCIISSIKSKGDDLWTYLVIIFGFITIPIHLLMINKKQSAI